jgi:hypothetical protein
MSSEPCAENRHQPTDGFDPDVRRTMPFAVKLSALAAAAAFTPGITDFMWRLSHSRIGHSESVCNMVLVALDALIVIGLLSGNRLAWQWGRILAFVAAIIWTSELGLVFSIPRTSATSPGDYSLFAGLTLIAFPAVGLWVVYFSLGRPSAIAYFGLVCPQCGQPTHKSADFLFNTAKCKKCGYAWR